MFFNWATGNGAGGAAAADWFEVLSPQEDNTVAIQSKVIVLILFILID
jgi:hypothetical protein